MEKSFGHKLLDELKEREYMYPKSVLYFCEDNNRKMRTAERLLEKMRNPLEKWYDSHVKVKKIDGNIEYYYWEEKRKLKRKGYVTNRNSRLKAKAVLPSR